VVDSPPLFLATLDIIDYHSEQIRRYGGLDGTGDPEGLESAVAAPQHLYHYDYNVNLFDIATAYAFHISERQAFLDGNKRTGLQAAVAFLKINGYDVETSGENLFDWMVALAQKAISRSEFAARLRACSVREWGLTSLIRTWWPGKVTIL
jgi:death-on-curing protein